MQYKKVLITAKARISPPAQWPCAWQVSSLVPGAQGSRSFGTGALRFHHASIPRSGTRGFYTITPKVNLPSRGQDDMDEETMDSRSKEKHTALREIEDALYKLKNNTLMQYDKAFRFLPSADYKEPMVMLLGNHSSGKSTFINHLLGRNVQQTGVAPTDDGFTIIQRGSKDSDGDGPSVVSDPRYQLEDLRNFGPHFVHRFKFKTRRVPDDSRVPPGLMIVDTPGMIDTPTHVQDRTTLAGQLRGYDFLGVTRWFAKRCDVILLLFDPANPGTTGETLDVLTKSLAGFEHKFLLLLNKVDMFDKATDFARAYGALCWNLSKVLHMKDIPRIYTTFIPVSNAAAEPAGVDSAVRGNVPRVKPTVSSDFSTEEFVQQRVEVVDELMRAPLRRLDNLITETEEGAKRILLAGQVCSALVWDIRRRQAAGVGVALSLILANVVFLYVGGISNSVIAITCVTAMASLVGILSSFRMLKAYEHELLENCDNVVDRLFVGREKTVDLLHRWNSAVKPEIQNLAAVSMASNMRIVSALPVLRPWGRNSIMSALKNDVPQLRIRVAKFKENYHCPMEKVTPFSSSGEKDGRG